MKANKRSKLSNSRTLATMVRMARMGEWREWQLPAGLVAAKADMMAWLCLLASTALSFKYRNVFSPP